VGWKRLPEGIKNQQEKWILQKLKIVPFILLIGMPPPVGEGASNTNGVPNVVSTIAIYHEGIVT